MIKIKMLTTISGNEQPLIALLIDSVNSGASVGFIAPLTPQESGDYWQDVENGLATGARQLFVASDDDHILGAVQLSLCKKANGNHRGEVEKLMVHSSARGQGIGKQLMAQLDTSAIASGLTLLVLDTRLGDVASQLYHKLGYQQAGQIPDFARSSTGELAATVYFYKQLG